MLSNFVFVVDYIARMNILSTFKNEKGELTTLTTNHGLLASYTTQKVCFLTTNYGHNEFAELQIGKFIFSPQMGGSPWPFAELYGRFVLLPQFMAICRRRATKRSFLMTQALVTCVED